MPVALRPDPLKVRIPVVWLASFSKPLLMGSTRLWKGAVFADTLLMTDVELMLAVDFVNPVAALA